MTKLVKEMKRQFKIMVLTGKLRTLRTKLLIPDRFASSDPDYEQKINHRIREIVNELTNLG